MSAQKDIYVYMDWFEYDEPIFMGVLRSENIQARNRTGASCESIQILKKQ